MRKAGVVKIFLSDIFGKILLKKWRGGLFGKKVITLLIAILFVGIISPVFAATGINERINFQGKLVDSSGLNVANGSYDITFRLYDAATGGTNLWTETWNSSSSQVTVTDGIFRVALGTHTSLSSVDFNDSLYLSIQVSTDPEMTPRVRFSSVPYAFNANSVGVLEADHANDRIGIGTSSPSTLLQLGDPGTTAGELSLAGGSSGLLTVATPSVTTSWTLTLPSAAPGGSNYLLTGSASGDTTWSDPNGFFDDQYWAFGGNDLTSNPTTFIGTTTAHALRFNTDGTERMVIDETGNLFFDSSTLYANPSTNRVGIGTSNPQATFSVGASSGFRVDSSGDITSINGQTYSWPSSYLANQILQTDGSGNLSWVDSSVIATDGDWTVSGNDMYSTTTGNVGIRNSTPSMRLTIGNTSATPEDGGIVAYGTHGSGPSLTSASISGAGTRMMWVPNKSAFRAGYVDGNQWDDGNVGEYSAAFGYGTTAQSYSSFAVGRFNEQLGDPANWVATDPVFSVGNGTSSSAQNDAFTVLKNGKVGVGNSSPDEQLVVAGGIRVGDTPNTTPLQGTFEFDGTDFMGYDGTEWVNLSSGRWVWDGVNDYLYTTSEKNVGIGDSTPTEKLSVDGAIIVSEAINQSSPPAGTIEYNSLSTSFRAYTGTQWITFASASGTDNDWIVSSTDMYVDTSVTGNVGINTSDPRVKLDIGGWLDSLPANLEDDELVNIEYDVYFGEDSLNKGRGRLTSDANGAILGWNTYYDGSLVGDENQSFDTTEASWRVNMDGGGDQFLIQHAVAQFTSSDQTFNTFVHLTGSGNLGIGANPGSDKLLVNGNARINNTLYTNSIRARTGAGVTIRDDGNNLGLEVTDGGQVAIMQGTADEALDINGRLQLEEDLTSNPASLNGTIRWTGSDFEGRQGGSWVSLTTTGGSDNDWHVFGNDRFAGDGTTFAGKVAIGPDNTTTLNEKLEITGGIKLGDALSNINGVIQWDGADFLGRKGGQWVSLTGGDWVSSSGNLYTGTTITGNVGIGTSSGLNQQLVVDGAVRLGNSTSNSLGSVRYNPSTQDVEAYVQLPTLINDWVSVTSQGAVADNDWTVSGGNTSTVQSGNVGIGISTSSSDLNQKLVINGNLRLENGQPGTGSIAGSIRWDQTSEDLQGYVKTGATFDWVSLSSGIADNDWNLQSQDVFFEQSGSVVVGSATSNPSPAEKLVIDGRAQFKNVGASTTNGTVWYDGTDLWGYVGGQAKSLTAGAASGADNDWTVSGSIMFATSGRDVGIGTSSPGQELEISSAALNDPAVVFDVAGTDHYVVGIDTSDNDTFKISEGSGFGTNDFFTINNSGEVSIFSNEETLTLGDGNISYATSLSSTANGNFIMKGNDADYRLSLQDGSGMLNQYWNAYYDGADHRYQSAGGEAATRMLIDPGQFEFFVAPANTGSAGDVITWTKALNINSDAFVGIGDVVPEGNLHVFGEEFILQKTNNSLESSIAMRNSGGNYTSRMYTKSGTSPELVFATGSSSSQTGLTDRFTIENGGTILIGDSDQFQINSTGNLTRINDVAYSWPSAQGATDTLLQNDGSGNLAWVNPSTFTTVPAGSNGQVQFNNNGSFGASSNFYWDNTQQSLAIGTNTQATGTNSFAVGLNADATATYAFAFGNNADATATHAFSFGEQTIASGAYSFALGNGADANGSSSFAFGDTDTITQTGASYSMAMGVDSDVYGSHSLGFGNDNFVFDNYSFAFGQDSRAGSNDSDPTTQDYAFAFGRVAQATATHAFSFGEQTIASGAYSFALGNGADANGSSSLAFGDDDTVTQTGASYSMAMGVDSNVHGSHSLGFGNDNLVFDNYSFAFGEHATAGSNDGDPTTQDYAFAFGRVAQATATHAVSIGDGTVASGQNSFAFGHDSNTTAQYSFGFGNNADATAIHAFSFGDGTVASGNYSFAAGDGADASGTNALAFGDSLTLAAGNYSTAFGQGSRADSSNEVVFGRYNDLSGGSATSWNTSEPLIVVGNGSSHSSRSNALTLLKSGDLGIGSSSPAAMFNVGASNQFQVDSSGNLTRINDIAYSWPSVQATGNQVLQNDGSGNLSWVNVSTLATPAGSNGQIQFNDSGSFGASSNLFWDNSSGELGIGVSSPGAPLEVRKSITGSNFEDLEIAQFTGLNSSSGSIATYLENSASTAVRASSMRTTMVTTTAGSETSKVELAMLNNGNYGIRYTFEHDKFGVDVLTPTETLDVNGNARFRNIGTNAFANDLAVDPNGVLTTSTSDISLKENFETMTNVLEKINQLEPYKYKWKAISGGQKDIGLIAQDVSTIFPEITFTNENTGLMGINYSRLSTILVAGMQEQQGVIDLIDENGQVLSAQTSALESDLENLESLVSTQAATITNVENLITEVQDIEGTLNDFELRLQSLEQADVTEENSSLTLLEERITFLEDMVYSSTESATLASDSQEATQSAVLASEIVGDVSILGNLNVGILAIDGTLGTVDMLGAPLKLQAAGSGSVELVAGKVKIDTGGDIKLEEGKIKGNDKIRGNETIASGETELSVEVDWAGDVPVAVNVNTSYNTNVWVENISETGFIINVADAPGEDEQVYWVAVW